MPIESQRPQQQNQSGKGKSKLYGQEFDLTLHLFVNYLPQRFWACVRSSSWELCSHPLTFAHYLTEIHFMEESTDIYFETSSRLSRISCSFYMYSAQNQFMTKDAELFTHWKFCQRFHMVKTRMLTGVITQIIVTGPSIFPEHMPGST